MEAREYVILSGSDDSELTNLVCSRLGVRLGNCIVVQMPNKETVVDIGESVRGRDVFIIQTITKDVNSSLMDLLIMTYACKTSSARQIIGVIPYLPYCKQCKMRKRGSIVSKLLAQMMSKAGMTHAITIDLHQKEIQGFFDFPIDNLRASPFLIHYIQTSIPDYKNAVIVAKNPSGAKRAQSYAERTRLTLAVIHGEQREPDDEDDDGRQSPPPLPPPELLDKKSQKLLLQKQQRDKLKELNRNTPSPLPTENVKKDGEFSTPSQTTSSSLSPQKVHNNSPDKNQNISINNSKSLMPSSSLASNSNDPPKNNSSEATLLNVSTTKTSVTKPLTPLQRIQQSDAKEQAKALILKARPSLQDIDYIEPIAVHYNNNGGSNPSPNHLTRFETEVMAERFYANNYGLDDEDIINLNDSRAPANLALSQQKMKTTEPAPPNPKEVIQKVVDSQNHTVASIDVGNKALQEEPVIEPTKALDQATIPPSKYSAVDPVQLSRKLSETQTTLVNGDSKSANKPNPIAPISGNHNPTSHNIKAGIARSSSLHKRHSAGVNFSISPPNIELKRADTEAEESGSEIGAYGYPLLHRLSALTTASSDASLLARMECSKSDLYGGYYIPALTQKEKPPLTVVGDVNGRIAIIVDDIIDEPLSYIHAAEILKEKGACKVYLMATHGLFSGDAPLLLQESPIDQIIVTNTIPHEVQKLHCSKIETIDISILISEAIRRIHYQESMSHLFRNIPTAD